MEEEKKIRVEVLEIKRDSLTKKVEMAKLGARGTDNIYYVIVFKLVCGKLKAVEKYPKDEKTGYWASVPDEVWRPMARRAGAIFFGKPRRKQ